MPTEEWQDWMRWDGEAVELDPTSLGRKDIFESTLPMYDAADIETVPFSASSTDTHFSFEDAPFKIETDESTDFSQFQTAPQMLIDLRRPAWGYSPLTAAERQRLQDIAMPHRLLSQVKLSSEQSLVTTTNSSQSQSPSPEPKYRTSKNKKRKSSVDDDGSSNELCQSRKRGHNAIEKRYRTNLNDKISCLRQGIPPLWRTSSTDSKSGDRAEESDNETTGEKAGQQKYGKADILNRALEYIQHLESSTQRLGDEVAVLKTRVGAFERLAMSSSITMDGIVAATGLLAIKKETLQSIQADFKQIEHKSSSARNSKKLAGK